MDAVGTTIGGRRRALLGFVGGLVAGPLLILAAMIVRSGHLEREYEAAMLTDLSEESHAIGIRIDGIAPPPRQRIDLPSARLPRLVLFEPHARRDEGAVLEVVRSDASGETILRRVPLRKPSGDIRCVVVVTVENGLADVGPCHSLMRYL
ncbi:MAG: hypothetical protein HY059_16210 [Proteobacteria bacterium]|nr:hypothetical protein [Pseudomonadota bacterium]